MKLVAIGILDENGVMLLSLKLRTFLGVAMVLNRELTELLIFCLMTGDRGSIMRLDAKFGFLKEYDIIITVDC